MEYLKDKNHYEDTYDLQTIKQCLDYYWSLKDGFTKEKEASFKKYTQEKFDQEVNKCLNMMLFSIKGERYLHKKERIEKWIERDRAMQNLFDKTPPPANVLCNVCGSPSFLTYRDLEDAYEPSARMMFMFECTKCKKRQSLYEDGSSWNYEPPKCPKCKKLLKTDIKIKGEITIYTSECKKCGYKDKDVSDHKKWKEEQEAQDKKDKELLEKYRKEFFLSEKEGQEYLEHKEAMEYAAVVKEEEIKKYDNSYYPKSLKIKMLKVAELEKLLTKKLEEEDFSKFLLEKPEVGQFVVIQFTVQDDDPSRKESDSTKLVEKIIKENLEDTNWRLMTGGIYCRLGVLSGRLKGVENEEDVLELAGKKKEIHPFKGIGEKEAKYGGHYLVRLARLAGEVEGIERVRKRRLEKEPDGFLLNDGKVGYSCGICGTTLSGEETWWDLKGIRCLDCQRNLKEGVVPKEIFEREDYGYDTVVKSWLMKSDYGIHPSTLRKLCREGKLVSRDLKRSNGYIYERLFVVSENKKFFDTHPKVEPKYKITFKSVKDK